MISQNSFAVFERYKATVGHAFSSGVVTEQDRDVYFSIYQSLREAAEKAIAATNSELLFDIRSTRFSRDGGIQGQRPVDLWASIVNKESKSFGGYPQIYIIASAQGLEIGFAVSIHESDYFNAGLKRRNRVVVPILYDKLPDPNSPLLARIDGALSKQSGWQFGLKSRQGAKGNFDSLAELVAFLKSPHSDVRGGGSAFRLIGPEQIGQDFDLASIFTEVVHIFSPLMRVMVPDNADQEGIIEQLIPSPDIAPPVTDDDGEEEEDADVSQISVSEVKRIWLYAPGRNAEYWDDFYEKGIMAIGWDALGDLKKYSRAEDLISALDRYHPRGGGRRQSNNARTCFDFANSIQPGDLVFVKRGRQLIIGHGIVTGDYEFRADRPTFKHVRNVRWESRGEWRAPEMMALKTLTEITHYSDFVENLKQLVAISSVAPQSPLPATVREPYTMKDALEGLFIPQAEFERALKVWRDKKNLILQGPPGVGKSFIARRLAYALMEYRDPTRVRNVQFHQSYSYEDFVQGYRPDGRAGFELRPGVFMEFCEKARSDDKEKYVFIIDEINRGNLSRIFGELMLLIESDKRSSDWATKLTYAKSGEERFYVPGNVFILGLMNTADRSLSLVDYALRRRFGFLALKPQFEQPAFTSELEKAGCNPSLILRIVNRLVDLNKEIAEDRTNLGSGFCIGHSFFAPKELAKTLDDEWYEGVVETEIYPLLEEYWSDDPDHAEKWRNRLLEK